MTVGFRLAPYRAITFPPRVFAKARGHVLQHLIGHQVPVRVVDLLEVIEIEHHDAGRL
ncbi:MAG TPA: hypothetical protein VHT23_12035 [Gemmatimonadaceae bacterium]|jgi:hypothetical protein|nr:hypothetical protein [Gemmatimonadaceae bacterium]